MDDKPNPNPHDILYEPIQPLSDQELEDKPVNKPESDWCE
jgi:hypothetical protein